MKRLFFLFSLLFFLNVTQAQFFEIGVYTEPQVTWITSDQAAVISDGTKIGLNTGIEFNMFFMPNYAFTVAVNLNNQGGKLSYAEDVSFDNTNNPPLNITAPATLKHNLQYLQIPLGLKLKTEEMGYSTFYIHGGLAPMFNMSSTTSSEVLGIDKLSIAENVRLFNMNYFFGAGVEYRLAGNTALIFGLKWSAGFTDVLDNDMANNNLNAAGLHLGILF
jgi:hypothetical protein